MAEHCDYGEQEDNWARDIVISHITNKELKGKYYREENLSLTRLLEIVSTYHHKHALVLVSEETVNRTWEDQSKGDKGAKSKQQWQGKCWRCDKPGHMGKNFKVSRNHTCSKCGKRGHMEVCCHTKQDKHGKGRGKFGRKREGVPTIGDQPDQGDVEGSEVSEDDGYYVFSASDDVTDKKAALKAKYPQVFTGLGKLKNFQLKLHVDESVTSVAQAMRRILFSRKQKVVDKLEELDVIEKVNGPTSWINPLVSVEKPNGDVRICLDMRQANRAILREKHHVPTIEETLQEISGAKVFSKLDLNMAFYQVELAPESRDITTFAGPNGLYRYKRLIFGVNMAAEKVQHIMWQVLKDCPGAHNIHDDICVAGASEEEHDERLNQVMKKLEGSGFTLNYNKCQIGVSSMEYLGNVLTAEGLQVSGDKVEAIVQVPRPKDQSELQSFLGLAQYCSRFIPSFTIIATPLWDLTKSHAKWKWGTAEEKAFQTVKMQLTQAPVMAFFKQGAETRVTTDASPVGIGAVLEQKQEDGLYRPVHYASRKLTPPESRYSQFEREALAVKWGCEKFFLYIHGNEFEICTDHKLLVTVFGPHSKASSVQV
ncbi:hypothetical protein ACROYT_G001254 [Oculina patagonica]